MFVNVGASLALHFISFEAKRLGDENAEVSKIMALADEMRLCLEEDEVYAVCRKSFLSPSWAHEHEGAELRLELEPYLSLASIALKYIHLLELDTFTFGGFMAYSKQLVHKESVIVRYGRKDADTIGRTCTILVKYATKSVSLETRCLALALIMNMVFKFCFVRQLLSRYKYRRTTVYVYPVFATSEYKTRICASRTGFMPIETGRVMPSRSRHLPSKRRSISKSLNWTLLQLIFDYLR
ncbi:hypothetical protein DFH11DRAFT_832950 [Phellopilus nigrolimitatus]|nr:hypothetical protein DFH11DRAFT_832950 [Phellopilus nigrolimitatus]